MQTSSSCLSLPLPFEEEDEDDDEDEADADDEEDEDDDDDDEDNDAGELVESLLASLLLLEVAPGVTGVSLASCRTSRRAARPMLSLVMTRLSMSSEPSAVAMAIWLNSMR